MKYYRLLKESPELPKGIVLRKVLVPGTGMAYVPVSKDPETTDILYYVHVVEEQPEWFEEVEMIPVKKCNADALVEIDRVANEGDLMIGMPISMALRDDPGVEPDCDGACCEDCE